MLLVSGMGVNTRAAGSSAGKEGDDTLSSIPRGGSAACSGRRARRLRRGALALRQARDPQLPASGRARRAARSPLRRRRVHRGLDPLERAALAVRVGRGDSALEVRRRRRRLASERRGAGGRPLVRPCLRPVHTAPRLARGPGRRQRRDLRPGDRRGRRHRPLVPARPASR